MLDPMFLLMSAVEVPIDAWNKRPEYLNPEGTLNSPSDQPNSGDTCEPRQINQCN